MFPHTITIYHHTVENGTDKYHKTVLSGFYWYGETNIAVAQKGVVGENKITIISNADNAHSYGKEWNIQMKDRVILGEGKDISSFAELENSVTVTEIAINYCNSDVDNVVITGS